jgi:hypothetical protein
MRVCVSVCALCESVPEKEPVAEPLRIADAQPDGVARCRKRSRRAEGVPLPERSRVGPRTAHTPPPPSLLPALSWPVRPG